MPLEDVERNNPSPQTKSNPTDSGKSKASIKVAPDAEALKRQEEIEEKYLDEDGNPAPDLLRGSNPNRNTDKPDIDKPAY